MKRILLLLLLITGSYTSSEAQGMYAGISKNLIGSLFMDTVTMKSWQLLEGSVLSNLDDPEIFMTSVYRKGMTCIALLLQVEDTGFQQKRIIDIIRIKLKPGEELRTGVCRLDKKEDTYVVGLVKPVNKPYHPAIKAWWFNRDKRKLILLDHRRVDCINEGFGE